MPQNIRDPVDFQGLNGGGCGGNGGVGPAASDCLESSSMALERLRTMINVSPTSRTPDWVNPLEKIEQLLTCAICLDRYKNPKLLPCQHSFCMDPCLDGLIDIVRRTLRCPECRAEHPLPYEGVKGFQTNYTLMGFLDIHLQATEENASELESYIRRFNLERCKVCDEKGEVEYCPHCEKRICLECKSTHVDMIKRDLGRLMNQVRRLCTRITDTADTLSRGADSLTVNCDNVKEEIRDYVKRYIKELKKREDTLVSEVDAFYNAETRMIKTVRDNLELESSNINEACTRVEACLKGEKEMGDEELVRYKQMFTEGLEYLRMVNPDGDELTNKKLRFVVNDAHLLPHAITQFGELQICSPQYSHKLAQAEQIYVPRFLQLGLESDNYIKKRKDWDPSDSSTWQQQPQSPVKLQQKPSEDDAYSSRYRLRHLLEEQAWNRIRGGERPQQQQRQQRDSPKRTTQEDTTTTRPATQFDTSPWSRMQTMNDQSQQQQAVAETASNSGSPGPPNSGSPANGGSPGPQTEPSAAALPPLPPSNPAGPNRRPQAAQQKAIIKQYKKTDQPKQGASNAGPSTETHIPRLVTRASKPPAAASTRSPARAGEKNAESGSPSSASATKEAASTGKDKSPSEDRELDKRVANIRKEYEQRQQEQQRTILQIKQCARARRIPVDAASAVTASSEEEEEEEEENGEPIPVHVYPSPENNEGPNASTVHCELRVVTNEPAAGSRRKNSSPPAAQQQSNGTIDWKKYLIPSPPAVAARRSSTSTATTASTGDSSNTARPADSRGSSLDDTSWSERRRRFVRSKTNPDFCADVSSYVTNAGIESSRINRPHRENEEQRRRRFGGIAENASAGSTNAEQRGSPAKMRYRRKTERSHSGYTLPSGMQNSESHDEPPRFEISIGGNKDAATHAAAGPGARFYRVFTNPKIDYLSKGRCLLKFGFKGTCDGQFNWPRGVAIVPTTEEIVVCDSSNHRLQIFDKRGRILKSMGTYGTGRAEFDCLAGVCINKYRQFVVSDRYNHRLQIFDSSGRHLREFGAHGQTNGRFSSPWGVAVDQQGYIYVCDKDNHRVQIFQADGNFVGKFGGIGNREGQFQNPHFIACNRQNQLIVSDSSNHRIQIFDHNGHFLFSFGSEGFHDGQFKYPRGVAVDEQGFIAVADSGNNRIQIFYPDGRFYCAFGTWGSADGQLKGVEGVALTADGRLVVTDRENHRVQVF